MKPSIPSFDPFYTTTTTANMASHLQNTVNVLFDKDDSLNRLIHKLKRAKMAAEARTAADFDLAKQCYTTQRRTKALDAIKSAHKNRALKESIATAMFQLIAIRIERGFSSSNQEDSFASEPSTTSSSSALSVGQGLMVKSILSKLQMFQSNTIVPSDAVLMRKLARINHRGVKN